MGTYSQYSTYLTLPCSKDAKTPAIGVLYCIVLGDAVKQTNKLYRLHTTLSSDASRPAESFGCFGSALASPHLEYYSTVRNTYFRRHMGIL